MEVKKVERESGIELLRIVLMFMIIIHHLICQGLGLDMIGTPKYLANNNTMALLFTDNFLIIAVNCFFFISGYFGVKFRSKTLVSLLLQGIFYAIGIDVVLKLIIHTPLTPYMLLRDILCIPLSEWWFLSCYFFLFLIAPFLNAAVKNLSKQQYSYILIVLLILNTFFSNTCKTGLGPIVGVSSGYSLFSFSFIYLAGQYINRFWDDSNIVIKRPVLILIASLLCNFVWLMFQYKYQPAAIFATVLGYNSPFVLLAAISFFFCFKKIKFRNAFINNISKGVFGVYLIHVQPTLAIHFTAKVANLLGPLSIQGFLGYFALISIVVLTICLFIDKARAIIFEPVVNYIDKKTGLYKLDKLVAES